jgi:hypothetical protein
MANLRKPVSYEDYSGNSGSETSLSVNEMLALFNSINWAGRRPRKILATGHLPLFPLMKISSFK